MGRRQVIHSRQFARCCASLFCVLVLSVPVAVRAADPPDLSEIPEASATDNTETSRALSYIIDQCSKQYLASDYYSTGTYIEALKRPQLRETQSAARVEIAHSDPDKLRIVLTDEKLSAAFYADGKNVVQVWPREKQFLRMKQPAGLDAFSEEERAGEILDDQTNAISRSLVGSLLITRDPLAWLHANVDEYIYEGIEDVAGSKAWRIKFLQSNPDMVVVNWVDTKTFFLRKVAIIQALDEDGEYIQSYDNAAYGMMRLVIVDEVTTEPRSEDFSFSVPKGWQEYKIERPRVESADWESPLTRLFRAAAKETGNQTSVTLETGFGGDLYQQGWTATFEFNPSALASGGGESSPTLFCLTDKGAGFSVGADGTPEQLFGASVPDMDFLKWLPVDDGGLLIAGQEYGDTIRALDLSGKTIWRYQRNSQLTDLIVGSAPPMIYATYAGATGLYRIDAEGHVRFASRKVQNLACLAAGIIGERGTGVVTSSSDNELGFYDPTGKNQTKHLIEEPVGLMVLDETSPTDPIVGISSTEDGDYVLRKYDPDGAVSWTAGLGQSGENVVPRGLRVLRTRDKETTTTNYAVLLSDGRIHVISSSGKPLWRARLKGEGAGADPDETAKSIEAADLDRDGTDELYVTAETYLFQLTAAAAAKDPPGNH